MKTTAARNSVRRLITLVAAMILSWTVGGSLSVARAQEEGEPADTLVEPAESFSKEPVTRSHCGPNSQTVTFSGVTTWHLCFDAVSKFGLIIREADFRKEPGAPFVRVISDARISEIFVPYHPGLPRFWDVSERNNPLLNLSSAHCPSPRIIIGGGKVCREIRDRGIAWMDDSLVRRGQELVLWAVLDAGNYNYILEWSFRDDGSIAGRGGSTGPKFFGPNDAVGHMHNFMWRLDIDLDGAAGDSVRRTTHTENLAVNPSTAADSESLISVEGARTWAPMSFTTVEIGDDFLKNGNNRPTTYELVPLRTGTSRHSEPFTKSDFWVTAFKAGELLARDLPTYLNGEDVSSADVVVWYTGSEHHEENTRDEDRDTVLVLWTGFELIAKNMFDRTPFFPAP